MKKIKNKFIIIIITFLVAIIGAIFSQNINNKGKISSLVLRSGLGEINRNNEIIPLDIQRKYSLVNGDIVQTLTQDSLLIVTWGDGSITRLGGNSSIHINSANVASDLSEIQISFELLKGRTWSNVTSFFGEESYFLETFNDHEAAVRGTIFDLDLNKQYIYVTSHEVQLTDKQGKIVKIKEQSPFSIESFSFISLLEFINDFKDQKWQKLNKQLDSLHFERLGEIMMSSLEKTGKFLQLSQIKEKLDVNKYIEELDIEEKTRLYKNLLEEYQSVHFASSKTPELLTKKLELKQLLILAANDENKQHLIESTLYDIKEVFKTNNVEQFQKLLDIFIDNKNILNKLDLELPDILSFKKLSKEFSFVLYSQLERLKNVFNDVDFSTLPTISEEQIKQLLNSGDQAITNFLESSIDPSKLQDMKNKASGTIENSLNNLLNK